MNDTFLKESLYIFDTLILVERRMKFPKISELLLFLLFSTFHHCPAEECGKPLALL